MKRIQKLKQCILDYYNRDDTKALVEVIECHRIKSFSDDPKAIMSFSSRTASPTNIM